MKIIFVVVVRHSAEGGSEGASAAGAKRNLFCQQQLRSDHFGGTTERQSSMCGCQAGFVTFLGDYRNVR